MKHNHYLSSATQAQIIREYKQKNPDGTYTWLLKEIADRHRVSLSTVNKLANIAGCQSRPRGGRFKSIPDARTMKILRDASEPFVTLEAVGLRNPRIVMVKGKPKEKPLSRQRVSKIIHTWKGRLKNQSLRSKGFTPGSKIEWLGQNYIVLSYDNSHKGAVMDLADDGVIDPFCWVYKGARARFVEVAAEELTEEQVWKRYVGHDRKAHSDLVKRASNQ